MKPYVVSADIRLLLQEWATKSGFTLPQQEFFRELREEFQAYMVQIFKAFEFVSEDELRVGLGRLVKESGLPAVSLDRVYFRSRLSLEVCRLVDQKGDSRGLGNRFGAPSLPEQFRRLHELKEVVLVDDIVWTGDLMATTCHNLAEMGIRVSLICAGIRIEKVETKNGFRGARWLEKVTGIEVRSARSYEEVIDQVCERDFYPGVPLSGRTLLGEENVGVPYILPFGKPGDWASIPEDWELPFSKFCIQQTVKLFEEIEHSSGSVVRCRDLERGVISLPRDDTRFLDALLRE